VSKLLNNFNIIQGGLVEVAGIEPEFYSIYSGYCRVWCPYRCPSVQIKGVTHRRWWGWFYGGEEELRY